MANKNISPSSKLPDFCLGCLLLLISFFSSVLEAQNGLNENSKKVLHLASTAWCPYICDDENKPGFIVEYLRHSLADHDIHLEISILPWSRAIHMAQKGALDGLATATNVEAPDFFFTTTPTGSYQMCFFSRPNDSFSYTGRASLTNKTIGAVKDYGYGEPIDSMVSQPEEHERVELLSTSNPLYSLIGMLETSRIDLFVEDAAVVQSFLNHNASGHTIRKAGCLKEVPFYTAISPNKDNGMLIVERLSRILASDIAHTYYLNARKRYGLE